MLHGHTKNGQVPVSDTGTDKTAAKAPNAYQRRKKKFIPGTSQTHIIIYNNNQCTT